MTPLTRTTRASHLTEAGRLYFEKAALALKELAVAEEMPCVTAKSRRRSISIHRKTATKRAAQGEFLSAVGINTTIN
jgi:DNA-binding transcriptional LysR family regulator